QLLSLAVSEGVLPASLAQTAHRLASGGRMMGADRLAAAADRLAAALDQSSTPAQALAETQAAVEATVPRLEAWLVDRQDAPREAAA
ncbi:MAG: Hpt domain-containing protein, partial [Sphingomonadaceae bacterium]